MPAGAIAQTFCRAANEIIDWGWISVDMFFALSGFLITKLLLDEQAKFSNINFKKFFARRTLRIWPIYYTAILFACIIVPLLSINKIDMNIYGQFLLTQFLPLILFLGNYSLVWNNNFITSLETTTVLPVSYLIMPLWSLAVEEQFYLFWPLLLKRNAQFKHLCTVIIAVMLCSILARTFIWSYSRHVFGLSCPYRLYYFATISHIEPLMAGCLIAVLYQYKSDFSNLVKRSQWQLWLILTSCLIVLICSPSLEENSARNILSFSISAMASASLLLLALSSNFLIRLLSNAKLRAFGKLTYSMYIFHFCVIILIDQSALKLGVTQPWLVRFVESAGLTYLIALLSWHLFESKFNAQRARFAR